MNEKIKKIQMSDIERDRIRYSLVSHMNKKDNESSARSYTILTPSSTFFQFSHKIITTTLLFCILLVSGWGSFENAQKALPGEPLYFLKRNVTEPIIPLFLFSNEQLASYQAELVTRRVSEAKQLASSGQLTLEAKKDLEKSVVEHTEKIVDIIESASNEKDTTDQIGQTLALARIKGEVEAQATTFDVVSSSATDNSSNIIKPVSETLAKATIHTELTQSENSALNLIASQEATGARDKAFQLKEKVIQTSLPVEQKEKVITAISQSLKELNSTQSANQPIHQPTSPVLSKTISVSATLTTLSDEVNQIIATNETSHNQTPQSSSESTSTSSSPVSIQK